MHNVVIQSNSLMEKNVCKINLHNGIYLQHYQHKVTLRLERDH
jgi:hypothetical protein